MIIRFGLAFDGLRLPAAGESVDDVVLGPAGLLESQLGLPPVSAQPGETLLAYRTCLEEADAVAVAPRFYHRSLAVDPVGVARALLAWREQWYEAGWGGTFADDAPARLADLAAVEQLAMDQVPRGRGQRLQQVAAALVERSTQIERIELHDEPDDLPATWHTVLRHLEVRSAPGMELIPRAEAGTDLRRIQLRLLELYRQDEGVVGKREGVDPHRLLQFLVHPVGPPPRQRESGATEAQAAALRAEIDYWLDPGTLPRKGRPSRCSWNGHDAASSGLDAS